MSEPHWPSVTGILRDAGLIDTRWYDYAYRTGFSQSHNLSFSGGYENTNYYLALRYPNQEGIVIDNDFRRLSGRLNLDHRVGKYLKFGVRAFKFFIFCAYFGFCLFHLCNIMCYKQYAH